MLHTVQQKEVDGGQNTAEWYRLYTIEAVIVVDIYFRTENTYVPNKWWMISIFIPAVSLAHLKSLLHI